MMNQRQTTLPACLWMQAGVVRKKECRTDFECPTCRFDKALRKVCLENQARTESLTKSGRQQSKKTLSKRDQLVFWKDKLNTRPLSKRPCIHHMKGHIDFKSCPKSYHCIDCEFDQYFQDQFKVYTVIQPVEYADIGGINLPVGYYLHPGHTWLKIEDQNHVRIGMDDFATRLIGTVDEIEPLLIGKQVPAGQTLFSVFRDNNEAGFPSPVNGVVTETNANLRQMPELLNQEPYTNGWVARLYCPDLRKELKHLMFMDSASSYMSNKVQDLYVFLEEETGLMAADGGSLGSDLYGNLPDLSWERLVDRFINQENGSD